MKNKALLILAAGLGSRFGGNKQFVELGPNGESLLDYSIYDALECGFTRIIMVVRQSMLPLLEMRYSRLFERHEVIFCCQESDTLPAFFTPPEERTKPYGTAHALMCASQFIDYPTLIINADDYYGKETFRRMAEFMDNMEESQVGMGCFPLANTLSTFGTVTRGICEIGENNDLLSVIETHSIGIDSNGVIKDDTENILSPDAPASMNVIAITPLFPTNAQAYYDKFFNELPDNNLTSELPLPIMIDQMVKDGITSAKAIIINSDWTGVTYAEDKPIVMEKLAQLHSSGQYPSPLLD